MDASGLHIDRVDAASLDDVASKVLDALCQRRRRDLGFCLAVAGRVEAMLPTTSERRNHRRHRIGLQQPGIEVEAFRSVDPPCVMRVIFIRVEQIEAAALAITDIAPQRLRKPAPQPEAFHGQGQLPQVATLLSDPPIVLAGLLAGNRPFLKDGHMQTAHRQ